MQAVEWGEQNGGGIVGKGQCGWKDQRGGVEWQRHMLNPNPLPETDLLFRVYTDLQVDPQQLLCLVPGQGNLQQP